MADTVVLNKPVVEAGAEKIGQPAKVEVPVTGPARIEQIDDVEPVERMPSKDALEYEMFMQEPVTIMVHRSGDKQASPVVELWNNGVAQRIIRGQKQTIKRKYVEVLARARMITYRQDVSIDPLTREPRNVMEPNEGLLYPFDVIEDSDRGRTWLRNILQEA